MFVYVCVCLQYDWITRCVNACVWISLNVVGSVRRMSEKEGLPFHSGLLSSDPQRLLMPIFMLVSPNKALYHLTNRRLICMLSLSNHSAQIHCIGKLSDLTQTK